MAFDEVQNVAVIIGLCLIAIVFIYQTQKKHRRVYFLSFGLLLPIIGQSFYVIIHTTNFFNIELNIGQYIRDYLFGVFYFLIFIHFYNLYNENDNNYLINIDFGILSIFTAFLFVSIVTNDPSFISITGRFVNVIGLVCFAYISYVSFLVAKMLRERESIVECASYIIIFGAHIIYVLGDNFFLTFFDYNSLADTVGLIGLMLLFLNYLSNLDYLYRLPFPIYQLIIYNNSGLCVYSRSVKTKGVQSIDIEEMLFSGLISAISSGIKESLGTSTELRYIDATDKHILLKIFSGLTVVIISDSKSNLLLESIKTINGLINEEFRKEINESIINVNKMYFYLDSIVKTAFPYISINYKEN